MIKTYPEFIAVVDAKCAQYEQIPEEHLSFTGKNVHDLYKSVKFLACFASNAAELLEMMREDEDVDKIKIAAKSEHRMILRCLERLAAAEILEPTA